ncbi:MAG: helix-turn-helix transcriptional regulator [Lachnospiraceae bacterium]|nr:helix-turn-helix transcriptional regulator [Lachnospiraceae bacterium]
MDAGKTGKLIRELRTEKGLTQQELASLLNVSPTAVSKWENGRSLPDISMLEPLVNVFQVTFAEIILGERTESKANPERQAGETEEITEMRRREEKAESAIKSVIDEQLSRNTAQTHKTVRVIALVMILLALGLFVISLTGTGHQYRSSRDLSGLENIFSLPIDGAFLLDGKQYLPHSVLDKTSFEKFLQENHISSPDAVGKVVAFRFTPNGDICYYYCTVDALSGDWLLMYADDGTGIPNANNVLYFFGTKESIEKAMTGD